MHKCLTCNNVFSSNQMLEYHIKNKVCAKYKKTFSCIFCPKSYKTKYTFLRHLNLKHKKKSSLFNDDDDNDNDNNNDNNNNNNNDDDNDNNDDCNNINELDNSNNQKITNKLNNINILTKLNSSNSSNSLKKYKFQCNYCKICFTRKDSLKRHIKNHCKKNKKNNNNNSTNNNSTNNNPNNNNLNNQNNQNNNTNNTIYNNCGNTINITINNLGEENMNLISEKDLFRCINMCYEAIPALFKLIHIDTPENRNLYLTNVKNQFIYTYRNNKWSLSDIKYILDYLQKCKKDIIEEYIDYYYLDYY